MSEPNLLQALEGPAFAHLERVLANLELVRVSNAPDVRFAEVSGRRVLDLLVSASVPSGRLV